MKYFSKFQLTVLVVLRMLFGWHLMYEGIVKLLSPAWSSESFLSESQWILSGLAQWIISHDGVLQTVDFLNSWGLTLIGAGLILGLFTRISAYAGAGLLFIYYLNNPPLIGMEYAQLAEGNYLFVSKTLIEAVALLVVAIFPTGNLFGLDIYVSKLFGGKSK